MPQPGFMGGRILLLIIAGAHVGLTHEHHSNIPDGEVITLDPIDSILWWHILSMIGAFGILFPIGMVLGMVRSRWHVPVQAVGTMIAIMGWFLGHAHKGRQFAPNIHASFANSLMSMLAIQVGLGIYLKLHLERGFHGRIRWLAVVFHGIMGKSMPLASWTQMGFGGITALGFCRADHLGQCLAHGIMGSAFVAYGAIMTMILLAGQTWLKRTGKSQDFWDSLVITGWGCANTFTQHQWGKDWTHGDIQHTTMGIVWWCAGLLGLWLSRGRDGKSKRNIIPGVVIFLTGYAMATHTQHQALSTMVHAAFGYTLMAAGLTRIIEISFILKDKSTLDEPSSFQHLPPFLLFASGFIFMAATEEQLALVDNAGIDHTSYILILYSLAFLTYLFVQTLLHLFIVNSPKPKPVEGRPLESGPPRQAQGANEFELQGLISDDDTESNDEGGKPS